MIGWTGIPRFASSLEYFRLLAGFGRTFSNSIDRTIATALYSWLISLNCRSHNKNRRVYVWFCMKSFMVSQFLMCFVRKLRSRQFPAIRDQFGSFMQRLLPRCWAHNPENRPSIEDIDFAILASVDPTVLKQ
jgi:hypothetical protein